ncbi:MAG: hypothetical protein PHX34_05650 [Candidatus Shapirobacteria bacterium]|nr:hypothetical protein [Candidatus Shapirobacteria bacterium]
MSETGFDFQPQSEFVQKQNKTEKLVGILEKENIPTKVMPTGTEGFSEAIILNSKQENSDEKTVRVYRGVTKLDESILNQVPYAMRIDSDQKLGENIINNDEVKESVDRLGENPTYENFSNYINTVSPFLNKEQKNWYQTRLNTIEDNILEGDFSFLSDLRIDHYSFASHVGMGAYSPYISMALTPETATMFTSHGSDLGGILIMDVPLSKIEALFNPNSDINPDSKEVEYKGCLDKKYIKAIVLKDDNSEKVTDIRAAVREATDIVEGEIKSSVYSPEQTSYLINQKWQESLENDKKRKVIDIQAVGKKRVGQLFPKFSDVKIDPSVLEAETDIYKKYTIAVYDYYADQLKQLGYGYLNEEEFDRSNITEKMLTMLKIRTQRVKERLNKAS